MTRWPRAWRSSPVSSPDLFEERLEAHIVRYRGSSQISDLLSYHFGYGPYGPARRGKRLRPRLLLAVAQAHGASAEDALDAAAAIEILHNYSLVHDDIEDRDELRHGRDTLWKVYGVAQAINAGDAMCALSFLALTAASSRHGGERVVAMVRALHEAHATMCEGQALDLAFETQEHVGIEDYTRMISAKTAALFAAACELGALCAGCGEAALSDYRELGNAFGMAFQIQDDAQGVWASTGQTGKHAGHDIARRKWSFPVVWALCGPPSAARDRVRKAYRRGRPLDPAEVTAVIGALDELGAREAAARAAAEHRSVVERCPVASVRDLLLNSLEPRA